MTEFMDVVVAFARLWSSGPAPDLDAYLAGVNLDADQLSRIVRIDQAERWQRGDRCSAEEYLERYPALKSNQEMVVDLIYHEYLLHEQHA